MPEFGAALTVVIYTPGVNFTNILQAAFCMKVFAQLLCAYNLGL